MGGSRDEFLRRAGVGLGTSLSGEGKGRKALVEK